MRPDFNLGILWHDRCSLHEMGNDHPERPERLEAIKNGVASDSELSKWQFFEGRVATQKEIERAHDPSYVETIFQRAPSKGYYSLDPDTCMNPSSLEAAQRAAGCVLDGVDLIMKQNFQRVFCAVRPPGHHAEYHKAMGFCLFNNIAVGVRYLLEHYDVERVAVLDFDVHHGNGTEDILKDDTRVLFCSSFQHPFYPFTELVTQHPRVIHSPLPAESDGRAIRKAFQKQWAPALKSFKPEFVFFSAGFDAHAQDQMASLNWSSQDYRWLTEAVIHTLAGPGRNRILSALEGGYELQSLKQSTLAHLKGLTKP